MHQLLFMTFLMSSSRATNHWEATHSEHANSVDSELIELSEVAHGCGICGSRRRLRAQLFGSDRGLGVFPAGEGREGECLWEKRLRNFMAPLEIATGCARSCRGFCFSGGGAGPEIIGRSSRTPAKPHYTTTESMSAPHHSLLSINTLCRSGPMLGLVGLSAIAIAGDIR